MVWRTNLFSTTTASVYTMRKVTKKDGTESTADSIQGLGTSADTQTVHNWSNETSVAGFTTEDTHVQSKPVDTLYSYQNHLTDNFDLFSEIIQEIPSKERDESLDAVVYSMSCNYTYNAVWYGYTDNSNSHNRIDKFHNFSDLNVAIYPITKSGTAFDKNTYSIKLLVV